jgi:hypothetical protein
VFDPGDEVMFRFRLYSDRFTVGWGWAVDNIYIQAERPVALLTGTTKQMDLSFYPNPVLDQGRVEFSLLHPDMVSLTLSDISGKPFQQLNMGLLQDGMHHYTLEAATLPAGLYFLNISTSEGVHTLRFVKK